MNLHSQVTDLDTGINSEVDFSLGPAADNLFSLQSTGSVSAELFITHSLDREDVDTYSFMLFAVDRGTPARTSSAAISITITVR